MSTYLAQAETVTDTSNSSNSFTYEVLEPISNVDGLDSGTVTISAGGFADFVNASFNYILILVSVAAIIYFIYGGLTYLTTDIVTKKSEGKEIITRVVQGVVFVFLVFAIFRSINPDTLKADLNFSKANSFLSSLNSTPESVFATAENVALNTFITSNAWATKDIANESQIEAGADTSYSIDGAPFTNSISKISPGQSLVVRVMSPASKNSTKIASVKINDKTFSFTVRTPYDVAEVVTNPGGTVVGADGKVDLTRKINGVTWKTLNNEQKQYIRTKVKEVEQETRNRLFGISFNAECFQTCVAFMPDQAIQLLLDLKAGCGNCKVIVSGGTEPWSHYTHGLNIPNFDLSINKSIEQDKFIRKQASRGTSGGCSEIYLWKGFRFCNEKSSRNYTAPHWHVRPQ